MIVVCVDCGVEFMWDESPDDELCLGCWVGSAAANLEAGEW